MEETFWAVRKLFETLRQLASEGCSILYISHKLEEVKRLCDMATILRGGKKVPPQLQRMLADDLMAAVFPPGSTAKVMSETWVGGVLEAFGGGLLLLGLFTRPVAFILAGEMAVAYFQFHFPQSFWPVVNMGTPAVLYCFLWLYFSAAGPGPWSLDAMRGKA